MYQIHLSPLELMTLVAFFEEIEARDRYHEVVHDPVNAKLLAKLRCAELGLELVE